MSVESRLIVTRGGVRKRRKNNEKRNKERNRQRERSSKESLPGHLPPLAVPGPFHQRLLAT